MGFTEVFQPDILKQNIVIVSMVESVNLALPCFLTGWNEAACEN